MLQSLLKGPNGPADPTYLSSTADLEVIAKKHQGAVGPGTAGLAMKRGFDIGISLMLLPLVATTAAGLVVLNPIFNPGPLFYRQPRMGRNCKAFSALKFRSMTPAEKIVRKADDPLEESRINGLGRFMRSRRLDELPQVINVLRGDMSLIGPRPDYFHHARRYIHVIPGYRERHAVRPGISGLAQVELGYVNGIEATKEKVAADLYYIRNLGFRLELYVFLRTLLTVVTGGGK